jgi:hypothetical protein
MRSTGGCILTLVAGVFIIQDLEGEKDQKILFWLAMVGAVLWGLSAFLLL